jgi:hypothetical protein
MHQQDLAKVNVLVDKALVELVEALNLFPALQTIESCQAANNKHPWIAFNYGKNRRRWKDLTNFVFGYLGPKLAHAVGSSATLSVVVTENGTIQGELSIRRDAVSSVTKAVVNLCAKYKQ